MLRKTHHKLIFSGNSFALEYHHTKYQVDNNSKNEILIRAP